MPALAQGPEVAGRVLDRGGGLAAATVELQPLLAAHRLAERQLRGDLAPQVSARTRTDPDGFYSLAAPAAGFWKVVVRHPEYLPASHDLSPLLADRDLPDLALQRRSELVARLLDEDGEPIAGALLTVRGWSPAWKASAGEGWWPAERRLETRSDGSVALPCASLEKVSVAGWSAAGYVYATASCDVGWLELHRVAERRRARIVHPDGTPAAGVHGFIRWPVVAFATSTADGIVSGPFDWAGSVPVAFADAGAFYGEPRLVAPAPGPASEVAPVGSPQMAPDDDLPTLALPPTVPVSGRVVDTLDGRPVAGAWLWVGRGAQYFQTAGRDGGFSLRWPVAESAELLFGAPGYLTIAYGSLAAAGGDLEARLTPAVRLPGRVVDAGGEGIADAVIRRAGRYPASSDQRQARLQGGGRWVIDRLEERSREDGSFELHGLVPARPLELRVARSGYAVRYHSVAAPEPGEPVEELVITLARGRTGFGRVVNESEIPIAGAEVQLLPSLTGPAAEQSFEVKENFGATSDGEGLFTIHDLPLGTYYLAAKGRGFPELLIPGIEIVDGEAAFDLGTLVLVPGVLLSGTVSDEAGHPVAGAELSLRKADGEQIVVQRATSPWFASTSSRQNGSFHLEGLPGASRLTLLVTADGFLPRLVAVTTGDDDQRLDLELAMGARVSGRVLDDRGRPAAAATVELRPVPGVRNRSTASSRQVETDAEGRFAATEIQPDTYDIRAFAGRMRAEPVRRIVGEEGVQGLDLQLRQGASIEVTVADATGAPVHRVMLSAESATADGGSAFREFRRAFAFTDAAGAAVLQPLASGSYEVTARRPGFQPVRTTVAIDGPRQHELELQLEDKDVELYPVVGRVVDPSGLPVSDARVVLGGPFGDRSTASDRFGRFELRAPAGEYRLVCRHRDFAGFTGEPFALTAEGLADVLIELASGMSVVGRVSGLELEDLARLTMVARGPLSGAEGFEVFDRLYGSVNFAGDYRIDGLQPGEWMIRAELLNPTRAASEVIEVARGVEAARVDLHFEDGYRLTGSVGWRGEPLAGATVALRCAGEFRGETFTDAAGRFSVDHVPAGRCTVTSTDPRTGFSARRETEIAFDADIDLEIREAAP